MTHGLVASEAVARHGRVPERRRVFVGSQHAHMSTFASGGLLPDMHCEKVTGHLPWWSLDTALSKNEFDMLNPGRRCREFSFPRELWSFEHVPVQFHRVARCVS